MGSTQQILIWMAYKLADVTFGEMMKTMDVVFNGINKTLNITRSENSFCDSDVSNMIHDKNVVLLYCFVRN